MTVYKTKIFNNESRGTSLIEVILAISIIAVAAPFMYKQIQRTYNDIENVSVAQKIVDIQDGALNYIRVHQEDWDNATEIQLTSEEVKEISPLVSAAFIDRRQFRGTNITDVYLVFRVSDSAVRTNQIARQIGGDAAIVSDDGIAYGATWAAAAPDFTPGDLVYRVSHNFSGQDRNNFLHRGASSDNTQTNSKDKDSQESVSDNLNAMLRNLNMGGKDLLDIGVLDAKTVSGKNANTTFLESDDAVAGSVYFSSGANIQGADADIETIRALGDISGFRNITANTLNGSTFSNTGTVITDSATINKSVRIGNLFKLKSSGTRTVNAFTAISANTVYTPYVTTTDLVFYGDFGLTVSGELLLSRTAPLKIGSWIFPSTQMPTFSQLNLGRTKITTTPNKSEFSAIMSADWQTKKSINK
ncbi:MAG: hypothetical protein KBT14_00335 [Proteobacteria bacterium]|nr:hypothetical protein [Candidatus Enterousia onthequi]